jgi:cell wall assembly regulator SMI1/predicted DNA-binding WGR domain protein
MPRYEFSEGSSNKFWEITLQGNDVVTHYGRIGSDGQSTTKSFKDSAEAKHAYDKLIAEKTKKGYTLAGTAPATAEAAPSSAAPSNKLIARLDTWMKKNRPEFYAHLKPGAPAQEIEAFEKELGCKLPETLKGLLLWRNGEDDEGPSERFLENYSLMNLEEIAGTWRGMQKVKKPSDFKGRHYWNVGWIPFLENGGGDYLCIDLNGVVGTNGSVIEYWHDEDDRSFKFDSINQMLTAFVSALEAGKWELQPSGFFDWDQSSGSEAAGAEDEESEECRGVQRTPDSVRGFMAEEYPRIVAAIEEALGNKNAVQLLFDGCDGDIGVLLMRAFRQMGETLTGWSQLQPDALKKVQSVIVRPGEDTSAKLSGGSLNILISDNPEEAEDLEDDLDVAICRSLGLPRLRPLKDSINSFAAEMNEDLRLSVKLEIDWPSFASVLNADTVSSLQQELDRYFLYWLRGHAGDDKTFRLQMRHAVSTVRLQHVSSVGQRKLSAEGSDLVYRLCLTKDGGTYAAELEELLPKVVLKMKALSTPDKPALEEKDFKPEKPPGKAASILRSIDKEIESLCKATGSAIEFEIDWKGFDSKEALDKLLDVAKTVCTALSYASENSEFKSKAADRLRCVRLRPAASPAEKKMSVAGFTVIYRLSLESSGTYDRENLQEYFEELIDAMKPGAPPCASVTAEIKRIESELEDIAGTLEKELGREIPVTLDHSAIGNNFGLAREIDPAVFTKALRELPRNNETKSRLAKLAEQITKINIIVQSDPGEENCKLKGKELIVKLPALEENIAYWFRNELGEIERQEDYEQRVEEKRQEHLDSIGPQFRQNFKDLQSYVKQVLEVKLEGNVDAMAALIGTNMKKFVAFINVPFNFFNAIDTLRSEDPQFAKALEKVKTLRLEGTNDDEKEVRFKDGVITYRFNIIEKKTGGLTEAQLKSKLKKLLE